MKSSTSDALTALEINSLRKPLGPQIEKRVNDGRINGLEEDIERLAKIVIDLAEKVDYLRRKPIPRTAASVISSRENCQS